MGTTICRKCGETIPGGTLLAHERTTHPVVTAPVKPKVCRRTTCKEVYGPLGHIVGLEGPHAY
jgi:hypothetical protein